jgi:hypothetical protein
MAEAHGDLAARQVHQLADAPQIELMKQLNDLRRQPQNIDTELGDDIAILSRGQEDSVGRVS